MLQVNKKSFISTIVVLLNLLSLCYDATLYRLSFTLYLSLIVVTLATYTVIEKQYLCYIILGFVSFFVDLLLIFDVLALNKYIDLFIFSIYACILILILWQLFRDSQNNLLKEKTSLFIPLLFIVLSLYNILSVLELLSINILHILSISLDAVILILLLYAKNKRLTKIEDATNTNLTMLHISEQNINSLYERFQVYMLDRRPYLLDSCQIELVAKDLYTNKTYLSKMVNSCTGMNFPKLMNKYRVEYAMQLFKENPRLKVAELASMSGFNSTVTFNMAFKYFENLSPSEWCRDYRSAIVYRTRANQMGEQVQG